MAPRIDDTPKTNAAKPKPHDPPKPKRTNDPAKPTITTSDAAGDKVTVTQTGHGKFQVSVTQDSYAQVSGLGDLPPGLVAKKTTNTTEMTEAELKKTLGAKGFKNFLTELSSQGYTVAEPGDSAAKLAKAWVAHNFPTTKPGAPGYDALVDSATRKIAQANGALSAGDVVELPGVADVQTFAAGPEGQKLYGVPAAKAAGAAIGSDRFSKTGSSLATDDGTRVDCLDAAAEGAAPGSKVLFLEPAQGDPTAAGHVIRINPDGSVYDPSNPNTQYTDLDAWKESANADAQWAPAYQSRGKGGGDPWTDSQMDAGVAKLVLDTPPANRGALIDALTAGGKNPLLAAVKDKVFDGGGDDVSKVTVTPDQADAIAKSALAKQPPVIADLAIALTLAKSANAYDQVPALLAATETAIDALPSKGSPSDQDAALSAVQTAYAGYLQVAGKNPQPSLLNALTAKQNAILDARSAQIAASFQIPGSSPGLNAWAMRAADAAARNPTLNSTGLNTALDAIKAAAQKASGLPEAQQQSAAFQALADANPTVAALTMGQTLNDSSQALSASNAAWKAAGLPPDSAVLTSGTASPNALADAWTSTALSLAGSNPKAQAAVSDFFKDQSNRLLLDDIAGVVTGNVSPGEGGPAASATMVAPAVQAIAADLTAQGDKVTGVSILGLKSVPDDKDWNNPARMAIQVTYTDPSGKAKVENYFIRPDKLLNDATPEDWQGANAKAVTDLKAACAASPKFAAAFTKAVGDDSGATMTTEQALKLVSLRMDGASFANNLIAGKIQPADAAPYWRTVFGAPGMIGPDGAIVPMGTRGLDAINAGNVMVSVKADHLLDPSGKVPPSIDARVSISPVPNLSGAKYLDTINQNFDTLVKDPTFKTALLDAGNTTYNVKSGGPLTLEDLGLTIKVAKGLGIPMTDADGHPDPSVINPTGVPSLFVDPNDAAKVSTIVDAIIKAGGSGGSVNVGSFPVVTQTAIGPVQATIYRVTKDGKDTFIEMSPEGEARTYGSFSDWEQHNTQPPGKIWYPADGYPRLGPDGKFLYGGIGPNGQAPNTPATPDTLGKQALDIIHHLSPASIVLLPVGLLVGGPVGAAAVVVGTGLAAVNAGEDIGRLIDRGQHGQDDNPFTNTEARLLWGQAIANGFAVAAPFARLGAGLAAGSEGASFFAGLAGATQVGANVTGDVAMADSSLNTLRNWDSLSNEDRFWFAASVLGFSAGKAYALSRPNGLREMYDPSFIYGELTASGLPKQVQSQTTAEGPAPGVTWDEFLNESHGPEVTKQLLATMKDYGIDPETKLYRWVDPEYLGKDGTIAGNPNSVAAVTDPYDPVRAQILEAIRTGDLSKITDKNDVLAILQGTKTASTLGPSLNVSVLNSPGYSAPGKVLIAIKLGDVLAANGLVYPDVGAAVGGIKPLIVTLPNGATIPYTIVGGQP